ncbi:lysine (K)-specific demethylase 5Ba [Conger conger]|uniref:lysine (K)-specific demethylase 5Ba n=1 Tax=Conger conger TaxID=82655 RepID=UPI002A5A98C6|nr:lysine (K)-specific demethylase 5Ba [Conger conger]
MTQPRPEEFIPPPECPVFEPSWEEFADPFAFINKIRPIAEKTGICKVRPPPDWQPPFACDVDRLHFTPRIQRLNELEAQNRVKLNFLDQITKFWELQGCTLKIPHVERKILDLYQLNKLVAAEGGFHAVCRERRWSKIAASLGFTPGKAVGSHLRGHYERILFPYSLFQARDNLLPPQKPTLCSREKGQECRPHALSQRQGPETGDSSGPARRANRMGAQGCCVKEEPDQPSANRPNLRRRMGSLVAKPEPEVRSPVRVKQDPAEVQEQVNVTDPAQGPGKRGPPATSIVDLYVCQVCGSGSSEDRLLLCDGCDDSYHTFCLVPPLSDVPKGDWRCPQCLTQECSKTTVAFGFEQAYKDYSLRAFGDMADSFKSDYFNMPVHMVPTELVEKEFWRLVSTIEEDVTVEYGADIASRDFGSGFPIRNGRFKVAPEDEAYLSCGWNLNNLPVMEASVLTHVSADICGMKRPWLYVGMCFSSFCWHIEDHWSYSINFLHWGEPKTWYGAPGFAADRLEEVMKRLTPELFLSQPDLLHQLVTIMNPNTLMEHGVPIYRTNQCAGEFVITFPRAYHSGFNQGFNFAEAVNFCTVDWMPLGRQCVDHYRMLNRYCVFSHDELICKMAAQAGSLDVVLASAVQKDMAVMIREERELREGVRKLGVARSRRAEYDLLPDEERQCSSCRTTCYLSALTCPCSPGAMVCLHHAQDLCPCPVSQYTLHYRFTLDELYPMMNAIRQRAESYDQWASDVTDCLGAKLDKKRSLAEFRTLIQESEAKAFPDNDLLRHLRLVTQDAEKCASVAQQLLNGRRQTRSRCGGGRSQNQLTAEELRCFVRQLYNLPCSLRQAPLLKELLGRVEDFQQHSEQALAEQEPSAAELQGLVELGSELALELPELPLLRERLAQARWLEQALQTPARPQTLSLHTMRRLIDQGVGLAPHPSVERAMARLQELLTVSEHWEERAHGLLRARPRHGVDTLAAALRDAEGVPAHLPTCLLLRDALRKAQDWLQDAESLQLGGRIPVLDALSDLVSRARAIPVQLGPLSRLEGLVSEVQAWRESAATTFLKKGSPYSLLEVLCPLYEEGTGAQRGRPRKLKDGAAGGRRKCGRLGDVERALCESQDSASAMATLAEVRLKETAAILSLRAANESKLASAGEGAPPGVCVCGGAPGGAMRQCELCRDAFHLGCVEEPEETEEPGEPGSAAETAEDRGVQAWLCPRCLRSLRPPLDRLLPLLASLQRLRVHVPEGHALRYLIQRTAAWQHRLQLASACWRLPVLQERPRQAHTAQRHGKAKPCPRAVSRSPDKRGCAGQSQAPFHMELPCIPLQGLSPELEELMVEGLLLQVSLPEIQQLHHILLNRPSSPRPSPRKQRRSPQGRSPAQNQDGSSGAGGAGRKAKRRLERQNRADGGQRARDRTPQKKPKLKRQKSPDGKPTSPSLPLAPPHAPSPAPLSDDSEEDMELCPAGVCQQPEADEVDWVQCDGGCNQWFHQVCVGVCAERAEEEDYVCVGCAAEEASGR